jgi:hypothetical protein
MVVLGLLTATGWVLSGFIQIGLAVAKKNYVQAHVGFTQIGLGAVIAMLVAR